MAKRSRVLSYLSVALGLSEIFSDGKPAYLPVPAELEREAAPAQYRWIGSRAMGRAGLEAYCNGFEMTGNLIIGTGDAQTWPEGNRVVRTIQEAGFRSLATGDYRLTPDNPLRGSTIEGADMDALSKATAGAISGVWK